MTKWLIKTEKKSHTVQNHSSQAAVDIVRQTDHSKIISVQLLPGTIAGKAKRLFRSVFKKQGK